MKTNKKVNRDESAMSPFIKWKMELHEEDIAECGSVVKRPDEAYHLLYEIYRKSIKNSE